MSLHLIGSVNFAGERREVWLGTPPGKQHAGAWMLLGGYYAQVHLATMMRQPSWRRHFDKDKAEALLLAIYGPDFTEAE